MNSQYLIKLATKQPEMPQQRYVSPLAQILAQQRGVNVESLKNRDMSAALSQLTDYVMGKGTNGACNAVAQAHTILPQDDNALQVMNSDYANNRGYRGACDFNALSHKTVDPNVLKGMGQNSLSMNKFQNIANPRNIGKLGRKGGGSIG